MRPASFAYVIPIIGVLALAGCAGNGEGLDENGRPIDGGPIPLAPTFESIQQNVFTPICSVCHQGATAPLGMRLTADVSYAMIVNVDSVEVPTLRRIQPGDPNVSYLVQKIEGRAAVGGRMPLNGTPLPQATIDVIRQWVASGAPRTSSSSPSAVPAKLTAVTPMADEILGTPPHEILLSADTELDTNRLDAMSVTLERSGLDGSFAEGNEVAVAGLALHVRVLEPTVIAVSVPKDSWLADSYRLRVAGGGAAPVTDRAGRTIDGDGDGQPGGDFIVDFDLGGAAR
jgi:hypothetical protein